MEYTELQLAAVFMTFITLMILGKVLFTFRPQPKSAFDMKLDQMINGFNLSLPQEVEEYEKIAAEHPNDTKILGNALMRRAIADIPLFYRLQNESQGMDRLKRNDILKDAAFHSFEMAEKVIENELKAVKTEANRLRPNQQWGKQILPQAMQFYRHLQEKEQREQELKKKALAQKQQEHDDAIAKEAEVAREEKKRQKVLEMLEKDDEVSKKKQ